MQPSSSIYHVPRYRTCVLALCLLACVGGACAPATLAQNSDALEVGLQHHWLQQPYRNWRGLYVTGSRQQGEYEIWRVEAAFQQRFGDQGFLYKVQTTRGLGGRWYGRAGIGVSSGGFFQPRYSLDVQVARKWLRTQRLVTLAGLSTFDAKDVHRDYAFTFEALYYTSAAWVVQGSVRWNLSTPGAARSRYQYLALTYGHSGHRYLSLRIGFGRESYTLVDPLTIFADYKSTDILFGWRQWIKPEWGFAFSASHYSNSFYNRSGIQIGFFKHI